MRSGLLGGEELAMAGRGVSVSVRFNPAGFVSDGGGSVGCSTSILPSLQLACLTTLQSAKERCIAYDIANRNRNRHCNRQHEHEHEHEHEPIDSA